MTLNLINACIKGQINDSNCSCSNQRQFCQTNPSIAFQLADLITDGLNMSTSFQEKFLFQLNQANKQLGRKVVLFTKMKRKKNTKTDHLIANLDC